MCDVDLEISVRYKDELEWDIKKLLSWLKELWDTLLRKQVSYIQERPETRKQLESFHIEMKLSIPCQKLGTAHAQFYDDLLLYKKKAKWNIASVRRQPFCQISWSSLFKGVHLNNNFAA